MANVLPSRRRNNVGQLKPSTAGPAVAAPPSTNRARLTTTARKALSSLKASTNRAKRLYLEDIPHRIKCYIVSAKDDTDVGRSHRPHQQHSINHGPNNGLRYDKLIGSRGASTGHYTFGAWQDFKSPMPESPFTLSVTPPKPALKVLHLGHHSVIKTPRQLLTIKYFKDLPTTFLTEILRGTAHGNITVRRPEKKGGSLSHQSAIPIPLNDVLPWSPIRTNNRATCGKRGGPVLKGLIGVEDIDITSLRLWDDADSQVAVDVDGKDVSSKGPVPENIFVPKVSSFKLLESIPECPDETHEQCGSSTTTPPASDTPERGTSRNTGGGFLSTSGHGDTPSFEGQSSSSSRGKDTENQDQIRLAIDSSEDSPTESFSPLPLLCWHAARGFHCCDGNGHRAPEFRRLWGDHYCSNHHLLYMECQRCKRLFVDKRSWTKHERLLRSPSSCWELSYRDLQAQNEKPNRKGITEAQKEKVEKAIKKYTKDGISSSVCSEDEHDKWVDDNCKLYIGQSSTTKEAARLELGKWLVAWYIIFPDVEIPSNPFTINIMHQEFLGLISENLGNQSKIERLPHLNEEEWIATTGFFLEIHSKWQLRLLQASQTPKTTRRPPKRSTVKRQPAKGKPTKRLKITTSGSSQLQVEHTVSSAAQPLPPVGFRLDLTPYPTAASSSTPMPPYVVSSFNDSAITDLTSGNDTSCIDPKILDTEGQTNEEGQKTDTIALLNIGARFINPNYPEDYYGTQNGDQNLPGNYSMSPSNIVLEGLGPPEEEWLDNLDDGDC